MSPAPLIIRADSNTQIGTGHIMRCIALAQAWQDQGGDVTFLSYCDSEVLRQRILNEGFDFIHIKNPHPDPGDLTFVLNTLSAISHQPSAASPWLALDGYHFTPDYQKAIRDSGYRLLVIDDMAHFDHYHADILVNQNINAPELNYSCDKGTIQLLGCDYVMLRREFLEYKNWKREFPEKARKILVTLGGADPDNVTLKVIKALKLLNDPNLEVKVVVGPSNPHLKKLQSAICNLQSAIHILQNVTDMPSLMAWADLAISAGGTTCWEMAFMGLPNMIVILAENQRAIASGLNIKRIAANLGWYDDLSPDKIAKAFQKIVHGKEVRPIMSEHGQKLVDGFGGKRVVKSMMVGKLTLRAVQEQDCKLIWEWANDPDVREVSFSSNFIPWDDHVQWFNSKLNDPNCYYYIAVNESEIPIGQVRFDRNENEILISVSVSKEFRSIGYGSLIIKMASKEFFKVNDYQIINAYIKEDNETSKRAFLSAGFENKKIIIRDGEPTFHLILRKTNL